MRSVKAVLSLGCAVVLLGLVLAASATASRRPTPGERAAITKVAEKTKHAGAGSIYVAGVWVSRVGPWATAKIAIDVGGGADYAFDVLHKVGGRWRLTRYSPGSVGEQCGIGMPRADQKSLGFSACIRTQPL